MKLYDRGPAPNPRRVRVFLAEKRIEVPMVPIDLGALEHKSADFAQINPLQRIPVLVLDDGTAIAESIAICRYFEELHPEPALFGRGAREIAALASSRLSATPPPERLTCASQSLAQATPSAPAGGSIPPLGWKLPGRGC